MGSTGPASGNGKVAIVTGAASGMGADLSRDLLSKGWKVGCLDLNEQAGQKLANEHGDRAIFVKCNVGDYDDQARAFATVFEQWGRLDALLANAGIVDRSSIYILMHRGSKEIPPAPDVATTTVDYLGVVYGTQLAIHFMRQNPTPGGTIVATASIAAVHPHSSYPEYCGAKAAVLQFCRTVAPVIKVKENISINVVLPGIVHTSIIPQAMVDAVSPECLTPAATIVRAYNEFLSDTSRTGQVVECSVDKILLLEEPPLLNGRVTKRACTVWDPLFKNMHGEDSGIPDAIQ
ncbi:hypothetical protein H2204_010310 [Knufia peltigerae]|uniref:15-hydroxyprostaglandin dehydrogenase n=1 Tax=Knufia peltigerae TaxID=1002370 RepID=A0AA38XWM3_9EURO|nr:hypothetical protein H2204_010310 [Knufia peltigerae]